MLVQPACLLWWVISKFCYRLQVQQYIDEPGLIKLKSKDGGPCPASLGPLNMSNITVHYFSIYCLLKLYNEKMLISAVLSIKHVYKTDSKGHIFKFTLPCTMPVHFTLWSSSFLSYAKK